MDSRISKHRTNQSIHNLWKELYPKELRDPKPMLIHKIEAEKTKQIFKSQK